MTDRACTGRDILIVDDDDSLRQILTWAFEDLGYRVWAAADYRSALILARDTDFDCALLDYCLPGGTGHRLSQLLTEIQPGICIVLMSCDRAAAVAEIVDRPCAAAFVDKPIQLAKLNRFFAQGRANAPTVIEPLHAEFSGI